MNHDPSTDHSGLITDILDGKVPGVAPPIPMMDGLDPEDEDGPPPPPPPADPDTDPLTLASCAALEQNDTDNGARLLLHFGADLLHVREVGWHTWSGRVWEREGGDEAVQALAQRTAKRIHFEADHIDLSSWEQDIVRRAEPLRAKDQKDLTKGQRRKLEEADAVRDGLGKRRSGRRKFATTSGNGGRIAAMIAQALPTRASARKTSTSTTCCSIARTARCALLRSRTPMTGRRTAELLPQGRLARPRPRAPDHEARARDL